MKDHQNIFFYYAGSAKAVDGRTRQIEDNTTKALINLLELSTAADPEHRLLRRFLEWNDISYSSSRTPRFALQLASIGTTIIERAPKRILLGIAPSLIDEEIRPADDDAGSRPDAWIWTRDFVVCIETKVVGTFNPKQLATHLKTLGSGSKNLLRDWKSVYAFFADQLRRFQSEQADASSLLLLDQFVEYLRIIAYRQEIQMGEFDGFHPHHFAAFTFLDEEDAQDDRRRVKHYLGQFLEAVREAAEGDLKAFREVHLGNVKEADRISWGTLSRSEKMVHEPHFSFMIDGSSVRIRLLIEGMTPTREARSRIQGDKKKFLNLLKKLSDCELQLNRRWQLHAQRFRNVEAACIQLDCVDMADVDYVVEKMASLEMPGPERGYFMIIVGRTYSLDDPVVARPEFAAEAVKMMKRLTPLRLFLEA